jgi:hypothetical protein
MKTGLILPYHTAMDWLSRLDAIPVDTLVAVVSIGCTVVFVVGRLAWLEQLRPWAVHYRALGHTRLHALRLAQADVEDENSRRRRETQPSYERQPSWFAATPAEREVWAQALQQERH